MNKQSLVQIYYYICFKRGDIIKKIIKAMLLITIFSVITRCLGFVFKIYLSRIMTTTELGIYNLTISIYMVLITIVGSSIPLTISKLTSLNQKTNNIRETQYSVTSALILNSIVSIFLSLIVLISKPLITLIVGNTLGYEILVCLIPSMLFTAFYSQIHGYLWGIENYFAVSIVEFIEQILRIGFCILFSLTNWFSNPALSVALALSIACGISTFYGLILYYKNGGKFKYKAGYFKPIISSSLPITAVRLFSSILQPIIAIILPIMLCNYGMSKPVALSNLGIIMGMTMPLLSIPSTIIGALCIILIPRINKNTSSDSLKSQINNYLKFTLVCVFLFIPVFISLSPQIGIFLFGNLESGIFMKNCSWTIIPMCISQITTSILNALNQEKTTFIYYIYSSIVMLLIIFILPQYAGVQTMLIAMGCSAIIQSLLNLNKINKLTQLKTKLTISIIYHALICIPVIILNNFLYPIINKFANNFISILFVAIISVITYISLLFVFGIFDISIIKNYFNKQKNSNNQSIKKEC